MYLTRREFIKVLAIASVAGIDISGCDGDGTSKNQSLSLNRVKGPQDYFEVPPFGNVSLLHITDCHAQLLPMYFREPSLNLDLSGAGIPPTHLVGEHFLKKYQIASHSQEAYAFTYIDFVNAARKFGKIGGFSYLSSMIKKIRLQRPGSLLLDGGDTWQGSATSLWTKGQDMIDAALLLGVDIMTAHWEFTYGEARLKEVINGDFKGKIDFIAQNVIDNEFGDQIFKPYVMREINGISVAIIGQAFPYTPIANPRYFIPQWSFGIREERMQHMVGLARQEGAEAVILLSHNGIDVDLKMASRVTGIDAILGGHTHDAIPRPAIVNNASGKTLVMNSGCAGKFLSVLDLDVKNGKVRDFRYKILPVFSNLIEPDKEMAKYIEGVRLPFKEKLNQKLAVTNSLLYRRDTFIGTFDQLILDALLKILDAQIAFSPGFRWGMNVLPGDAITFEDVMTQTSITYAGITVNQLTGRRIKEVLEDVADNIFNSDPYYQQGGDMVRVGGLKYSIDPTMKIGRRIDDMTLNGSPIVPNKKYKVAGWASVNNQTNNPPVWDIVAEYLKDKKTVNLKELNMPIIKNIKNNPGVGDL